MTKLYAENILIGSQWQTDKTIKLDSNGVIIDIYDGKDQGSATLNGSVIPGMINCHSHAFQRAFAGFSEYRGNKQDSFWSWRDIMYRFVAKMTPEDAAIVAEYAFIELLKSGFTSVAEFHYLHHQQNGSRYSDIAEMSHQVINAALNAGINITHLPVLYSYAGFGHKQPSNAQGRFINTTESYVQLWERLQSHYQNTEGLQLGIAPHSLRAVSEQQLAEIIPWVQQKNANSPIHIHIAEQKQEVEDCLAFYGKRPVEWLLEKFSVDQNWCFVHATHLTEKEVTQLASSGAVAGICPITEANLGDGIFPTSEYLQKGGRLAIGSDSHILINVAEELRLLEYGQRLTKYQRAVLTSEHCSSVGQFIYLKSAFDGALASSRNSGVIEIGKRADFVVLNDKASSMLAKQNHQRLDAAIFASAEMPISQVVIAGKVVVEDNKHSNQERVTQAYERVLNKLVNQ